MQLVDVRFPLLGIVCLVQLFGRRADLEFVRQSNAIDRRIPVLHIEPGLQSFLAGVKALDSGEDRSLPRRYAGCPALNHGPPFGMARILHCLLGELEVFRSEERRVGKEC